MLKNNGREQRSCSAAPSLSSPRTVDLFAATISARFTPIFAPINVDIDFDIGIDYIHTAQLSPALMVSVLSSGGGGGPACSCLGLGN